MQSWGPTFVLKKATTGVAYPRQVQPPRVLCAWQGRYARGGFLNGDNRLHSTM